MLKGNLCTVNMFGAGVECMVARCVCVRAGCLWLDCFAESASHRGFVAESASHRGFVNVTESAFH